MALLHFLRDSILGGMFRWDGKACFPAAVRTHSPQRVKNPPSSEVIKLNNEPSNTAESAGGTNETTKPTHGIDGRPLLKHSTRNETNKDRGGEGSVRRARPAAGRGGV